MTETAPKSLLADTTYKGIIMLTLPISLSRLIPELNFLFNGIFLGHLGTKELAYASLTGVYYLIFAVMGYGLGNALLSIISKLAGENNRENIFNSLRHGHLVGAVFFVIALILTYFFLYDILLLFGITAEDSLIVSKFLKIRIWGLIFLYGYQLSNQYLICIQETKWLVVGSIIEAGANIIFDYWFIFGGLGLEPMGLNGAAYASVLAEIIGFAAISFVIKWKNFSLKYDIPEKWRYSKAIIKDVLSQAYPLMTQYTFGILIWWFFFIIVAKNYNYTEQAASQTMRNLFGLSGVFSWAFGSSTNTIISNLIGQKKHDEIIPTIHKLLKISCTGMLIFIVLVNLFPSQLFLLYDQHEPSFIEIGTSLLRIVSAALLVLTTGVIWMNAAVASGQAKMVLFIEIAALISYSIYAYYAIEIRHWSISIAWMCEWFYWTTIMVLSYFLFKNWMRKEGHIY
jgi:multidrug resistance protein, MATE family